MGDWDRWEIGAQCEKRWQEASKREFWRRYGLRHPAFQKVQERWKALQHFSIKERQLRARYKTPLGEGDSAIDDAIGDVRDALDNELPSRGVSIQKTRPYGLRTKIMDQVAREKSRRFRRRITPSFVAVCWKEYRRRFLRRVDSDSS
jgi:hypothetical protein